MTETSGLYPELFRQLQREVARGKEAEKLLRLGDETFPKEMLDELINIGRQAQVRLDKFQSARAQSKTYASPHTLFLISR